jgi:hypothetical protein
MTYKRHTLPQISEEHLINFDYVKYNTPPERLVPSQSERVPSLLRKARLKFPAIKPIIIDIANKIVNGHHRYDVALELGMPLVPVLQVHTTLEELIIHFVKNKS